MTRQDKLLLKIHDQNLPLELKFCQKLTVQVFEDIIHVKYVNPELAESVMRKVFCRMKFCKFHIGNISTSLKPDIPPLVIYI